MRKWKKKLYKNLINHVWIWRLETKSIIFNSLFLTVFTIFIHISWIDMLLSVVFECFFFFNASWRNIWSKAPNHGYPSNETANVFSDEHRIASAGSRNAGDNSIIKVQVASRIYRRKYTMLSCLSEFQAQDDGRNTL